MLAALGLLLASAPPAAAHAQLLATDPANGALLPVAPPRITLTFSERITPVPDGVTVTGPDGPVDLPGGDGAPAGEVAPDAPERLAIALPADGLPDGVYTVMWRVVSVDSHPIHGALVFGVGADDVGELATAAAAGAAGAEADAAGALTVFAAVFRWLGYAALALLAGGTAFVLLCRPDGLRRPAVHRLLALSWGASLLSAAALLLAQGPYTVNGSPADLVRPELLTATLGTDFGRFLLARLALLVLGGVLLAILAGQARDRPRARRGRAERALRVAAGVVLLLALPATWTGTGHALAGADALSLSADTLHLTAMAVWLGGLVFLLGLTRAGGGPEPAELGAALRRFAVLASASVVVLAGTGLYRAWRQVGSVEALTGTRYGMLLVLKLAALGVVLWAAALTRAQVRRRYAPGAGPVRGEPFARRQLSWTLRVETGFVLVVLAVTSVLAATPPGSRPDPVPVADGGGRQAGPYRAEETLEDGGGVLVELDPARTGPTVLRVTVTDGLGGAREVPEVTASLTLSAEELGPLPVTLTPAGPGAYRADDLLLPRPGDWQLELKVRTTEIDLERFSLEFPVAP
ncbi:copper resistance CopC/CopD family protein [Streptomyces carpaticus]|uniref:Copper resistance protein CopC n=1 Tax=Streptomyces carpaticus TaxID=285558 RepID=A0ABV4ZUK9_9ACTN